MDAAARPDDPTDLPPGATVRVQYPRWLWGVGAVLLLVVIAAVVAITRSSGLDTPGQAGGAVEQLFPAPGSQLLQQGQVGIDLEPGFDAQLYVAGEPLPMDEVVVEKGLNTVTFQPGPGKTVEFWPAGETCLTARYWPTANPQQVDVTTPWCFTVL